MKIKKIAALGLVGAFALAGTAAATTLSDFVHLDGSTLTSPTIVIGDTAKTEDVIAGIDIGAAMAGFATKDVVSAGSAGSASVSGGYDISTTNTKLYLGDALTKEGLRTTLTGSELPIILASGELQDEQGALYPYDQYVVLGSQTIEFSRSGTDLDNPEVLLTTGSDPTSGYLYQDKVVFNKPLNVTASKVTGQKLTLFGKEYSVASGSTATKLILYGGANKHTLKDDGETVTITVDGVDHNVELLGVAESSVVVKVDGIQKSLSEGQQVTINGAAGKIEVRLDEIMYIPTQGKNSFATLSLGASKLTLENGQMVLVGNDNYLTQTRVAITSGGTGEISTITINVTAEDSQSDYVKEGMPFVDPVFGSFKVSFGGYTAALGDESRSTVALTPSSRDAAIKMTDYRGNEASLVFAHDTDTSSTSVTPDLADGANKEIIVVEGAEAELNEYVVLSQGDFSHLYKVTQLLNIGNTVTADAKVRLQDVFSGETLDISLDSPGYTNTTAYIDGQTYFVNATSSGVKFTWGTSAAAGSAGNETVLFPGLWGKNGESVHLMQANVTFSTPAAGAWYYLPGDPANAYNITNATTSVTAGQITYTIAHSGTNNVNGYITKVDGNAFGGDNYPAVLVVEEKGQNLAGTDVRDAVFVATAEQSTDYEIKFNTPAFTDASVYSGALEGTDKTQYLDRYGTLVEYDTSDNQGKVMVYYPNDQATAHVAVGADPQWTVGGASTGGTYKVAVPIKNPVAKFASEVATDNLAGDLILVGGPCVNNLVKELLASDNVTCDNWPYQTGIIKVVENAFNSGQKALIVAGTTKEDTRDLADNYVMKGTLTFDE